MTSYNTIIHLMLSLAKFRLNVTNFFFLRGSVLREENYVSILIIIKNTTPKPGVRELTLLSFTILTSKHFYLKTKLRKTKSYAISRWSCPNEGDIISLVPSPIVSKFTPSFLSFYFLNLTYPNLT